FLSTESSCSIASRSAKIRLYHSTIRLPSVVKPWKRWWRRTIGVPNSISSCLMALERLGWDTLQCRAARLKCCSWASATRYSSWRRNISLPRRAGSNVQHLSLYTKLSVLAMTSVGSMTLPTVDGSDARPRRALARFRLIDRLHWDRRRPAGALLEP